MKFGKEFKTHLEETLPEWRDKFLCYKPLKKLLKSFPSTTADPNSLRFDPHQRSEAATAALVELQQWFVRILNEELEKFNDFYVDKEEDFVIRLKGALSWVTASFQGWASKLHELHLVADLSHISYIHELKERIELLKDKSGKDGAFTSDSEFSEEMMDIRKDLVAIHGEMVLLKNYSSLNFAGLVKILKKYDKRTGGLLRLPFTQLALHQPFFTTEPLTRLVRDCEASLELLFPLEAEVIESSNADEDLSNPLQKNIAIVRPESPSTLEVETVDIYRSTLAAMKAIRGLQKASSTYDPLSFTSLFKNRDDEGTGAVTAANSANSSATMQNGEETDEDDVHSV